VTASGQFCWPPTGSYMTAHGQDLMAADTRDTQPVPLSHGGSGRAFAFGTTTSSAIDTNFVPFGSSPRLYEVMDDIPKQSTLHEVPISAQAGDRWRLTERCFDEAWSEHLTPTAALLTLRVGQVIEKQSSGVDSDLRELADCPSVSSGQSVVDVSGFAASVEGALVLRLCKRCGGRPLARAWSGAGPGAGAVRAGRARSGRCSGRSASPDRVSSEVGSGRSCVGVVGGHTPLQVPLRGTCGAAGDRSNAACAIVSSDGAVGQGIGRVGVRSCA